MFWHHGDHSYEGSWKTLGSLFFSFSSLFQSDLMVDKQLDRCITFWLNLHQVFKIHDRSINSRKHNILIHFYCHSLYITVNFSYSTDSSNCFVNLSNCYFGWLNNFDLVLRTQSQLLFDFLCLLTQNRMIGINAGNSLHISLC